MKCKKTGLDYADIRARLNPYAVANNFRAFSQLATTLLLLIALSYLQWRTYAAGHPIASLAFTPIIGLLLIRCFVLQHDCGHLSFFSKRWTNNLAGVALSPLTLTPFLNWRYSHNLHHATCGNLDRRLGYFWVMTAEEYRHAPWTTRLGYRLYRHPLSLFGAGSLLYFLFRKRFPIDLTPKMRRELVDLALSNVLLVALYSGLAIAVGPRALAFLALPSLLVGCGLGTWINYMQHVIPEAYLRRGKEWNFCEAGLEGSTFYDLPRWLHWFTANIGYHHIHHFESRIPNYNLPRCMEENRTLFDMPVIRLRDTASLLRLRLWDESRGRYVAFSG